MAIGKNVTASGNTVAGRSGGYLPEWARLLKMHWPRTEWLNDGDFSFAVRHINKSISKQPPTDEELLEVVAWMAGPESKQTYSPTLREMVINVFMYRKRAAGYGETRLAVNSRFIDDVRRAMEQAQGWRERWNIMCNPANPKYAGLERDTNYDETRLLNDWAARRWPEWEEMTARIRNQMAADLHEAIIAMGGGNVRRQRRAA